MTKYARAGDLEKILNEESPELKVEIPALYATDMTTDELRKSIKTIRDRGYVENAIRILNDDPKLVKSITYAIVFPNQRRNLDFKVDWVSGPDVFIGWIISNEPSGKEKDHARLYGMWDKRMIV
jgi:hypothetical protein